MDWEELLDKAVLCYVEEPWAFFTTCALRDQWGDDWNDAPYEHNAGRPYDWRLGRDVPEYEIVQVAYEAELETPRESVMLNSRWCVDDINAGAIPWLYGKWAKEHICIHAGTTLREFIRLVESIDGTVYLPKGAPCHLTVAYTQRIGRT